MLQAVSACARHASVVALIVGLAGCAGPSRFDQAYAPVADPSAPPQTPVCPDTGALYTVNGTDNKTWEPTRCEQLIMRKAINYCLANITHDDMFSNMTTGIEEGGNGLVLFAGVATAIAGLVTKSTPAQLAGVGTLVAGIATNSKSLIPSSEPAVKVSDLVTAASTYVAYAGYGVSLPSPAPPQIADATREFYAGLWNAVGSACPTNYWSQFKMVHLKHGTGTTNETALPFVSAAAPVTAQSPAIAPTKAQ